MSIRRRIWKKAGLAMSTDPKLAGAFPKPTSRGRQNHTAFQAGDLGTHTHTYPPTHTLGYTCRGKGAWVLCTFTASRQRKTGPTERSEAAMWWLQARPLGWTTQAAVLLRPLPGGVTLGLRLQWKGATRGPTA